MQHKAFVVNPTLKSFYFRGYKRDDVMCVVAVMQALQKNEALHHFTMRVNGYEERNLCLCISLDMHGYSWICMDMICMVGCMSI